MLALPIAIVSLLTPDQTLKDGRLDSDVFAHPQWALRPALRYPIEASQQGVIAGVVDVRCKVGEGGRPEECEAILETPSDLGFGLAAVEGIQTGVLASQWVKDWPKGVKFAVRVQFVLGD